MAIPLSALILLLVGSSLTTAQYQGTLPTYCGSDSYDCVPYFQCGPDGVIKTDGEGILDIRTQPPATCSHPDYPDVVAVCCLKPGYDATPPPVTTCPAHQECVDFIQCGDDGRIVTDGSGIINIRTLFTPCYYAPGLTGRCCTPKYIDACPSGSTCVLGSQCSGQALDWNNQFVNYLTTGNWLHCQHGAADGVCCQSSVIDACPQDSVCVAPHECTGTALDASGIFVDYVTTGQWTHCSAYENGVCCVKPKGILRPAAECGVRQGHFNPRITVNEYDPNREAVFGEFPWQVILFYQNYTYVCGGTLVSPKHVITAAHCVDDLFAADIKIRLGDWQVSSFDEPLPYEDKNVHSIAIHPKFNPKNVHNDVAVLELATPVDYQYHINRACLPAVGHYYGGGTRCITTGWGKDSFNGQFQHILKKVTVPLVDYDICQDLLRKTRLGKYFKLDESFLCAGGEENADACSGDGGGPLVCQDPATQKYVLVGITAWGIDCGKKDVPGVYADVAKFIPWLAEKGVPIAH